MSKKDLRNSIFSRYVSLAVFCFALFSGWYFGGVARQTAYWVSAIATQSCSRV